MPKLPSSIGSRHLGGIDTGFNFYITVAHLYHRFTDSTGNPLAESVGITIREQDEDDESEFFMLTPQAALMLANRLVRAAELVMESDEGLPDIELQAARFQMRRRDGDAA